MVTTANLKNASLFLKGKFFKFFFLEIKFSSLRELQLIPMETAGHDQHQRKNLKGKFL